MKNNNRVLISTILGMVCGATVVGVIWFIAPDNPIPPEINLRMILSFTLLGIAIGVNPFEWPWALNGLALGGIVGLMEGLAAYAIGGSWIFPLVTTAVFGLLIEWVTTVGFKAGEVKMQAA